MFLIIHYKFATLQIKIPNKYYSTSKSTSLIELVRKSPTYFSITTQFWFGSG